MVFYKFTTVSRMNKKRGKWEKYFVYQDEGLQLFGDPLEVTGCVFFDRFSTLPKLVIKYGILRH